MRKMRSLFRRRDPISGSLWVIYLVFMTFLSDVIRTGPQVVSAQVKPNASPKFLTGGDLTKFSIPEDTPVGSVVYRLKGVDPEGGELTYSISGEYLRVNKKTGDLTLIKSLDREVEPKIDVIISLTDDGFGSEPSTVSLRREIYIQDRNDNPPIFHKRPYSFKVVERARVGSTVFADIPITDADFGRNSQVTLNCSYEETPLACRTFSVGAEKVGDGKYIGIISLAEPLDYETHSSFAMALVASDGVNNASALVAISVTDLQDQAPKFFGGPYVFKMKENALPGSKVGEISCQDADVGNPRALQLRLIDEADNEYFKLNDIQRDLYSGTYTAVVETTNYTLDAEDEFIRENLGVYELILEAREVPLDSDDLEPTLTTRTGMAIMVSDVDDHIPEFRPATFDRILRIPYTPGESWSFPDFRVEAEDEDVDGHNSKFELKFDWNLENYKVPVGEVFSFVTPSPEHPIIQSKGIITMEVANVSLLSPGLKIGLQIGAYQKGHLVSNLNVPIEVASGPKILPSFSQNVYKFSVPEDIPEGGLIAKISARNHDELDGIRYTLIGAAAERFTVDETTGEIRCKLHCLDFEKDKSHFFLIRAKAGDGVDEEVFALFHLNVIEKNDNIPEFINVPGIMTLTPNGNVMKRAVPDGTDKFDPPFFVRATDSDLNDKINYTINDHSMANSGITIDHTTGELQLTKPLRWSESGEHKLTITATDTTGKFTNQQVLLVVQAVENIPPTFPYQVEQIQIPETLAKGSPVFLLKAHDPDGQDASIKYYIDYQPTPDLFLMEESTGTIRLNGDLDYDSRQRVYRVQVRAEDEGKPAESAKAFVEIAIVGVNSKNPKFEKSSYSVEISETAPKGSSVVILKAEDLDQDADLEYAISCPCQTWDASGSMGSSEDAEKFFGGLSINSETGEITLKDTFSHKQTSVLEFIARVVDKNGISFQNDSAPVTLYVTAAERNKPIFGHPWSLGSPWINLTIPEDLDIGTAVVSLNAWDYIAGKAIVDFELLENETSNFGLNDSQLVVVSELDYELQDMYILQVKAKDERGGESIANLGIQVSDVNDHSPSFAKKEYKAKVQENAIFPTPIITVSATDLDDPSNYGAIRYALTGPQSDLFIIDSLAGIVQVAPGSIIDREKDETHSISVLAMDTPSGGPFQRTTSVTLHIIVEDENDNDPICDTEDYLVAENAPVGSFIGFVHCKDVDQSPNITFRLIDPDLLNLFSINQTSGRLTVAKGLRGRGRMAPYVLGLIVEDGKERTISLSIGIKVSNVIPNDGKPQFNHKTFNYTTLEGAPRGTHVLQVKASDTDAFDNGEGRLSYHLLKQIYPCHSKTAREKVTRVKDVELFRLDEHSGSLTLKEAIDREKMDCFSILISVQDSGTPPQSESAWFEIYVQDIDDSPPYLPISDRIVQLVLNESTPQGSPVHSFDGRDEDLPPNNIITFELSGGGSDLFQVIPSGPQTANLVLNVDLGQMEHDDLTLLIKCHPTGKRVPVPDCISKVNIKILRDSGVGGGGPDGGNGKYKLNSKTKYYEMIVGAAAGSPVGNLIGNAGMPKKIRTSEQMYHPTSVGSSPTNVTELVHIDEDTGDIFVWDNLEKYSSGHLRVQMVNEDGGMKKNLKVFIAPNENLLHASMIEFSKLKKWVEETDLYLNSPRNKSGGAHVKMGQFHVLTFDQSNAADGKTRVCFQLLENENMMSQDKAMKILEDGDLQDLFLKYTIDEVQKGCPTRPKVPARLSLVTAGTGRFWVERSLLGIASVVCIACISSILILCLLNRNRGKH